MVSTKKKAKTKSSSVVLQKSKVLSELKKQGFEITPSALSILESSKFITGSPSQFAKNLKEKWAKFGTNKDRLITVKRAVDITLEASRWKLDILAVKKEILSSEKKRQLDHRRRLVKRLKKRGFTVTPSALTTLESIKMDPNELAIMVNQQWAKIGSAKEKVITVKQAVDIAAESSKWKLNYKQLKESISSQKKKIPRYLELTYFIIKRLNQKKITPDDLARLTSRKITSERRYLDELAKVGLLVKKRVADNKWEYELIDIH